MEKIIVIVQARMASTRLPGKVLKCIQGKTLLEHCLERLQQVPSVDQIVVATTLNSKDMSIINLCEQLEVKYYRGSESDVLSRFYEASLKFKADVIIRVNSDCPLIDPEVVESIISQFIEQQPNCDYISNILKQTYPRGMHTEIFSFKVLEEAYKEATAQSDREHVTPYIYLHPDRYQISHALYKPNRSYFR
jgi:spore coat polysaccharide biosynthesis protein SpsF